MENEGGNRAAPELRRRKQSWAPEDRRGLRGRAAGAPIGPKQVQSVFNRFSIGFQSVFSRVIGVVFSRFSVGTFSVACAAARYILNRAHFQSGVFSR